MATSFKEAFTKAGVDSPTARLEEIALKAMVANAADTEAAIEAIWRQVRRDRDLLVALFEPEKHRAISALLYRTRNTILREERNQTLSGRLSAGQRSWQMPLEKGNEPDMLSALKDRGSEAQH